MNRGRHYRSAAMDLEDRVRTEFFIPALMRATEAEKPYGVRVTYGKSANTLETMEKKR